MGNVKDKNKIVVTVERAFAAHNYTHEKDGYDEIEVEDLGTSADPDLCLFSEDDGVRFRKQDVKYMKAYISPPYYGTTDEWTNFTNFIVESSNGDYISLAEDDTKFFIMRDGLYRINGRIMPISESTSEFSTNVTARLYKNGIDRVKGSRTVADIPPDSGRTANFNTFVYLEDGDWLTLQYYTFNSVRFGAEHPDDAPFEDLEAVFLDIVYLGDIYD